MTDIYRKLKPQIDDPKRLEIEVTAEEWDEVLSDPATLCGPTKPMPPIKSEKRVVEYQTVRTGLFSSDAKIKNESHSIEYDHQDPAYLKALDDWANKTQSARWIMFYGKKVVLKKSEEICTL